MSENDIGIILTKMTDENLIVSGVEPYINDLIKIVEEGIKEYKQECNPDEFNIHKLEEFTLWPEWATKEQLNFAVNVFSVNNYKLPIKITDDGISFDDVSVLSMYANSIKSKGHKAAKPVLMYFFKKGKFNNDRKGYKMAKKSAQDKNVKLCHVKYKNIKKELINILKNPEPFHK